MAKTLIQFDGSNFYNKVKQVLPGAHLTTFDYAGLARMFTLSNRAEIVYYVGAIKKYPGNHKSQTLYAHQQALFNHLRRTAISIKLGYLLLANGTFHEKGVDVQMAVDMVRGAIKGEYDVVYLISSDTDLLPAIKTAKDEGKQVIYVGFENFVSQALARNCTGTVMLTTSQLRSFLPSGSAVA